MTRDTANGLEIDITGDPSKESSNISVNMGTGERRKASISEIMPQPPKPEEHKKESFEEDILVGENSPFAKYKERKMAEYIEDMAKFDEKRQELIEEGELDPADIKDGDFHASNDDDPVSINVGTMTRDDDLDLSGLDDANAEIVPEDAEDSSEEVDALTEALAEDDAEPLEINLEESEIVSEDITDLEDDGEDNDEKVGEPVATEPESKQEDTTEVSDASEESGKKDQVKKEEPEKPKYVSADDMDVEITTKAAEEVKDDDPEESEEETNTDNEQVLNHLRKLATERIKPTSTKLDLSTFTVAKKATADIGYVTRSKENRVSKWVLPGQEQIVLMKEFSGVELQTLLENMEENSVTSLTRRYRMIYEHIVSPKPETFEKWVKSTPAADLDHYYFAIFIASYKGANYLPADCVNTQCTEGSFISEDINIMDMVKFEDDETKKKFKTIYTEETAIANKEGIYLTETVPISDKIAIGFKEPTLYSFIEPLNVDDRFRRRYENIINIIPYIDEVYMINAEAQQIIPVDYTRVVNSPGKNIKNRVRKYSNIINTLTPDQFNNISAYVNDFIPRLASKIHYVEPELTCPYCGTTKPETETTAENLVFTRYQLGALVTTTQK